MLLRGRLCIRLDEGVAYLCLMCACARRGALTGIVEDGSVMVDCCRIASFFFSFVFLHCYPWRVFAKV